MRALTKVLNRFGLHRGRWLLWARYSASSVVATVVSQLAFALCYWFGSPATVARNIRRAAEENRLRQSELEEIKEVARKRLERMES